MIEKSIATLICDKTFNVSDPSTWWAYNASYSLCPFCPHVNTDNEYCPKTPGNPITCAQCLFDYCGASDPVQISQFCGE
jgi:hypothetical protein